VHIKQYISTKAFLSFILLKVVSTNIISSYIIILYDDISGAFTRGVHRVRTPPPSHWPHKHPSKDLIYINIFCDNIGCVWKINWTPPCKIPKYATDHT